MIPFPFSRFPTLPFILLPSVPPTDHNSPLSLTLLLPNTISPVSEAAVSCQAAAGRDPP